MSSGHRVLATIFLASASGCYEIPPQARAQRSREQPAGWPPLAVYHSDPFHVANRLFQRLFLVRTRRIQGDVPVADRAPFNRVDVAEILGLLATLGDQRQGSEGLGLSPRGSSLLAADLRFQASILGDGEKSRAVVTAMRRASIPGTHEGPLPELPDPPKNASRDVGFPDGHPLPAGNGLEAWALEGPPGARRVRVYHLRRADWLRGGDGWVEVGEGEVIGVGSGAGLEVGVVSGLCGACHS